MMVRPPHLLSAVVFYLVGGENTVIALGNCEKQT